MISEAIWTPNNTHKRHEDTTQNTQTHQPTPHNYAGKLENLFNQKL